MTVSDLFGCFFVACDFVLFFSPVFVWLKLKSNVCGREAEYECESVLNNKAKFSASIIRRIYDSALHVMVVSYSFLP